MMKKTIAILLSLVMIFGTCSLWKLCKPDRAAVYRRYFCGKQKLILNLRKTVQIWRIRTIRMYRIIKLWLLTFLQRDY